MPEETKTQLKEVMIDAMGSFKKEHSDLMYEMMKEMRDSREDIKSVIATHTLDDQKNFSALQLELATLKEQTAPIRRAWSEAIKYGVAIGLGALGIKILK